MAPPQISSCSRNNPQHIGSNAMLRHKCTDKSIWFPIGRAGPNSSCQCTAGLLIWVESTVCILCIWHRQVQQMLNVRFKSGRTQKTQVWEARMVCAGTSELPSHMCHDQGCLAGLPLLSFPVLVAVKCPTDKSGLGSGKL